MDDWRGKMAQLEADSFPPGSMSKEDILGVWERHPAFAPGGVYGPKAISDFTRVCDQTGMSEKLRKE